MIQQLMKTLVYFPVCILLGANVWSQEIENNASLQKMADEDQEERMESPIDWNILNHQDSIRRVKVFELIEQQQLRTAKDHFNAGIVLQHGNDTIASAMAVKSFETAIQMDTTLNRWWYAAAVDRDLMRRDKPQIYGTQFIQDTKTGKWIRYKIDSMAVSDEVRRYYSVETLSEQAEKEFLMNQKPLADFLKETNSIEKTIEHIRLTYQKGRLSAHSLEAAINKLGYGLLEQDRKDEALKIFKLNTELFSESFNAYDSYGECLMASGKKKAALKAYRKSLKLNPENEHAKQVIKGTH